MEDLTPTNTSLDTTTTNNDTTSDREAAPTTLNLTPTASESENSLSPVTAEDLIAKSIKEGCPKRTSNDFMFLQSMGEGAYSQVFRCREVATDAMFAVKVLQKSYLNRHQKMDAIIREKNILTYLSQECGGHPFVTQLYTHFHDQARIYFVIGLVENGDLGESLCHFGSFDMLTSKFFASEILTGLQFLHDNKIVHRDMKPDNVLIQKDGHILITDFGSAQAFGGLQLSQEGFTDANQASSRSSDSGSPPPTRFYSDEEEENTARRTTFVGTALYVSPEMLADGDVGPQTDIWGLGCILFQCLAGQPPFRAVNQYHLLKRIQELDFSFPEGFPEEASEIIAKILVRDPSTRITSQELMAHKFFENVDWVNIANIKPPVLHAYIPATFGEPEYYSNIGPVEPGLDDRALFRLMNLGNDASASQPSTPSNVEHRGDPFVSEIAPRANSEAEKNRAARAQKLEEQRVKNPFHIFTNNSLILKQGYLEKKRGLFARRRMFLLTEGPHLLYIDVPNLVLKGEVPWTPCMQVELKNSGTFFIHTPNRVYYLFDLEKKADEWCKAINDVRKRYSVTIEKTFNSAMRDGTFGSIYGKKKSRKEMMREQKALRRKQEKEEKKALKAEQVSKKLSMQMDKKSP
ncbi:3-phosphoinositide-dependent protein kinase 1 [Caenorhabditis elegans]|uniref:Isoform b of 3-phosphoinositide-dependent protein kinase 1 n=1 Tax=Caenorhabditis elegans TaxID=6239 RepID=Q9Y1J3-2|nr:3-phosphoinositide-dependent protein kinase 1 [Caenorhabditis elegans]AAD42308.1 phophoinositide-dependent protein kinase 1b [Caenorhabditis elegans]CCD67851.1 3-phosphoinositide-dependent protein kinase 1 [Caenorhabditis elegans]|eukprot:NP_001024742.1 3-phosphoinositide-dependent protein kinase 1 [Caenorhabditis elegans]